tara:strand:- start:749 stop:1165 length:417 start_codon:yes stop_codon:yes gene_type:complete
MEVFLFILSFISGGVILTVAYTTYLTNATKTKQDKLTFMQEQLVSIQKKQFEEFDHKHSKTLSELVDIRSRMEGDQYRELSKTNQRITEDKLRLDLLIQDVNKMNIEQRGEINRIENDIQNRIVTVEKLIGNELKQNY